LGGGIEVVYGNFFLLLFMVIFPLLPGERSIWKRIWLGVRSLLLVSIIFLFLSAVQLIPFVELFHHSIRGKGISYQEATLWSFTPKDVLLFFLPDAYGYFLDMKKYWINQCWFKTLYTGGLPFILAFIFFTLPPTHPSPPVGEGEGGGKGRKLFFSLMVFSLFLSLGQYNPLYPYIFKYLPFLNGIRYPVKFLYIFILILAISAGLGFQRITEFSKDSENKKLKRVLIIFSLAFGLFLLFLVLGHKEIEHFLKSRGIDFPDFNPLPVNLHHAKRFLFYLTLFFLLLRIGHEVKWKWWAKVLLIFFLTADLFGNMGFYGKEKTLDYYKKTKVLEVIASDRENFRIFLTAKTISPDTPILIAGASRLDIFKEKYVPSLNLLYQLHDIWGIDVIRLKRVDDLYIAFINTPSVSATNLVDLYGVKYVISVTPIEKDRRYELIYSRLEGLEGKKEDLLKENTIKLYKVWNPFPRAWLVKKFRVLENHEVLSRMLTKEFRPDHEVLLEEEPISFSPGQKGDRGEVKFISESNNELHLRVKAKEDKILVLSDTYYPGWKVFVDGRREKIYRANYNFRAVPLKAGEHEVRFIYDPASFKIGALISIFTSVGIVVYFVKRRRSQIPN
jgi:hypothetical protein